MERITLTSECAYTRNMANTRNRVLETIADILDKRATSLPARVLRVAVTGITASGKSTLAEELEQTLKRRGRNCVHIAVDDFHNPRDLRYRQGRESAEGYYFDAYNYPLLKKFVLEPLAAGGNLMYQAHGFDLETDTLITEEPKRPIPETFFYLLPVFYCDQNWYPTLIIESM